MERQSKADWGARSGWARDAVAARADRAPPGPDADTSQPQAEKPDSLAAATEWLRAAPRRLAGLGVERLIDAVSRIEDAYARFPELELGSPRQALVEDLLSSAETAGNHAVIPLLMACAVLDSAPSSASVTILLDRMARAGHGEAIARAVAVLARRRVLACAEIAPALDELCRQGRPAAALAVISEALGHVGVDPDTPAVEFDAALKRILFAGADPAAESSGLAGTILSARNRVRPATRPPASSAPGPQLLALAERVAGKLPRRVSSPAPVATTTAWWRTGRLGLAEFAAQWPEICGVAVEWLPAMQVGRAGERTHAGVCAKPGRAGHLVYGPYVKLGAGDYRVRVRWSAGQPLRRVPRDQPVAAIEAVSRYGKTYLAQRKLRADDCERPEHELLFRVNGKPPSASPIEVRVWTSGTLPLTVSSIAIELIALPGAAAPRSDGVANKPGCPMPE